MPSTRQLIAGGVAAATIAALVAAYAGGVWDAESERYWKRTAQSAGLSLAERLTPGPRTTRYARTIMAGAFDILPSDATDAEIERAAVVLLRHGAHDEAATAWLGLAQHAWLSGDQDGARSRISRALSAAPTRNDVLLSQVVAERGTPREASALKLLATHVPAHPLVLSAHCMRVLDSFAGPLPAVCGRVNWVATLAAQGKARLGTLVGQIENLPQATADETASLEREIAERSAEQPVLAQNWHDLARQDSSLGGEAVGQFLLSLLPIPKPDESIGHFIGCLLRFARVLCAIEDAANASKRMDERRAHIHERQNAIDGQYRYNASRIATATSRIAYITTDGPRQELLAAIGALVPDFQAEVRRAEEAQFSTLGVSRDSALQLLRTIPG